MNSQESPIPSITEHAQGTQSFHRLMTSYGAVFDAYNLDAIMRQYHTPCFVYKDGNALFFTDEAHKRTYFEDLLARLRTAGVHHSDIADLNATPLGPSSAFVTVHWISRKEDQSVVYDFLDSYILARIGDRWKFLGDAVHEGEYSKATSPTPK